MDFSGQKLRGRRFARHDLREAVFRDADLRGTTFRADAVATLTGDLIDKTGSEPRNPALLKASADALLSSAGRLADRCKPVLNAVEQIVRLLGLG
jgi:uncharacterized protein YjbI with pentapeptide repeats